MHYRWNEFAIDKNKPTIKIKKSCVNSRFVGLEKSEKLSPTDKLEINRLYNCPAPDGKMSKFDAVVVRTIDESVYWYWY
jgi:hypothetical protein